MYGLHSELPPTLCQEEIYHVYLYICINIYLYVFVCVSECVREIKSTIV